MDTAEKDYQNTLDYLYRFVDFSMQRNFHLSPEKFNLARMREFAQRLGQPQEKYPIIHIAGTKGKGSVAALCAAALSAAGYRVGLYTSPHLEEYTERIQIDGRQIAQAELVELVEQIKPVIESVPELTTFEITTGLAFLYFAQQGVHAAVIEVGLGGRLDATNIVHPLVAAITSLSYDHTSLLGNTLGEIAGEKAGIIKPGRPVVLSPQAEEASQVVRRIAAERGASLIQVGQDYRFELAGHSLEGQQVRVWEPGNAAPVELTVGLLGAHQAENAATAYAVLRTASVEGLTITDPDIQKGFAAVRWPGRFEILRREPPVLVDSAHNRDSAARLRQALDDYFPGWPVVLVFGASEDKDIDGMLAELLPRVEGMIATRSIHPRAAEPEQLVKQAQAMGRPAEAYNRVEDALAAAVEAAGENHLVLVTGSIFVAAGARRAWALRQVGDRTSQRG